MCCGLEPAWWSRTSSALASSVPLSSMPSTLAAMLGHLLELSPPWSRYAVANSILSLQGRLTSTYSQSSCIASLAFCSLLQAVGASTRVFTLLDRRPQMVPAGHSKPQGSPEGAHVEFRNVSFAYPSRPDIQVHCYHTALLCPALLCTALLLQCEMQHCFLAFREVVESWLFMCCQMRQSLFAGNASYSGSQGRLHFKQLTIFVVHTLQDTAVSACLEVPIDRCTEMC